MNSKAAIASHNVVIFDYFSDGLCNGCKEPENNGIHEESSNETWNCHDCTKVIQTNAFGELKFPGAYSKKAKVIKIKKIH